MLIMYFWWTKRFKKNNIYIFYVCIKKHFYTVFLNKIMTLSKIYLIYFKIYLCWQYIFYVNNIFYVGINFEFVCENIIFLMRTFNFLCGLFFLFLYLTHYKYKIYGKKLLKKIVNGQIYQYWKYFFFIYMYYISDIHLNYLYLLIVYRPISDNLILNHILSTQCTIN